MKKQLDENNKQIEEIKQQNEKKDIDIMHLKEENEKLKNQTIIYNNCNNTYNNYILHINNFDDTKCEVVIKNLLKYMGKSIYLKTVEDIYLNNTENHNIYVGDKNRGIVKVWNNGIWQSKNMIVIDQIIDNIVKQFNLSIEEIKKIMTNMKD
jgi:phage-related tail fiber protein